MSLVLFQHIVTLFPNTLWSSARRQSNFRVVQSQYFFLHGWKHTTSLLAKTMGRKTTRWRVARNQIQSIKPQRVDLCVACSGFNFLPKLRIFHELQEIFLIYSSFSGVKYWNMCVLVRGSAQIWRQLCRKKRPSDLRTVNQPTFYHISIRVTLFNPTFSNSNHNAYNRRLNRANLLPAPRSKHQKSSEW